MADSSEAYIMVSGRGYGEPVDEVDLDTVDRFNEMVRRYDPYTGTAHPILSRISDLSRGRQYEFTMDEEPELDEYTQTLFLDDMDIGDNQMTGESYENLKALAMESEPEQQPKMSEDFLAAFGAAFN